MKRSPRTSSKPKVVIVGAGAGGIATAARLAITGLEVVVVEKNAFTGGCCSLMHRDGHRFDQGPTLVFIGKPYSSTYSDLGTTLDEEGVQLLKCNPNSKIHFSDGTSFSMSTDHSLMKEEIEKWEGNSGYERLLNFLQESGKNHEFIMSEVFVRDFPNIWSLLHPRFLSKFMSVPSFKTMYSRVSDHFKSDRLRQAFTFQSVYLGMSPYDASSIYSMLQYIDLAEGIRYPKGGFHKILEPLIRISEKHGSVYRLSSPVEKVIVSKEGQATGVKLSTGEEIKADIIILNSDAVYSYRSLLPEQPPSILDRFLSGSLISNLLAETKTNMESRRMSSSSISFYWGMDRVIPEFAVNNIFLAEGYRKVFEDIFECHTFPQDPCFALTVTSRIDPTAAPEGKDTIVVLIPTGILRKGEKEKEMDGLVECARNAIIFTIEKQFGFEGFKKWIACEIVDTPRTWEEKFNYKDGSILGLSHDLSNTMCFRPRIRHASIPNLFLVGRSTHPGTGVSTCLISAKLTSEAILKDLNIVPPWTIQTTTRKDTPSMDRSQTIFSTESSYLCEAVRQWTFYIYLGVLSIVMYFGHL